MTGTTQLHRYTLPNFQSLFNSHFRSWLVLNFLFHSGVKWTSKINNQALLFYFIQYRLVVFNLVVNLYFEVPWQLVVSGLVYWLWINCCKWIHTCKLLVAHVIHVKLFVIPFITQHSTYKISPSELSAPPRLPHNIDIAFEEVSCIPIQYG